jgi:hypothetical protein
MDKPSRHMANKSKQPEHNQNDENSPKHRIFLTSKSKDGKPPLT